MNPRQRVAEQPAWVLHALPWRETSLIVEVFARDYGRLGLVAKGARRPMSELRGVLMAFQPLLLDWSGGGELKTLVRGEWRGGQALLGGRALLCAYYVNELLLRLTVREDPHPALFAIYEETMAALARGEGLALLLRRFELSLLRELGYGVMSDADAEGRPIRPEQPYLYIVERGPWPCADVEQDAGEAGVSILGQTLIDLAVGDFSRPATLIEAKRLLRMLIDHHLGSQPLHSRRVFEELREMA